uniref:GATA-type domain-containing protein n=1 Tax=Arundo donax TaxID=35708 RepID=A0A0A9G6G0_ARUDO
MSTIYMSQLSTALPLMEGDHHQDHHHQGHIHAFTLPKDPPLLFPFVIGSSSTSDSSLSYGSADHRLMRQHQAMLEPQHMIGGLSAASVFATPFPTVESIRDDMIEPSSYDPYDMAKLQMSGSLETGSWTPPAKMRITRKASADPGAGVAAKKPRRRAQAYEDMSSQPSLGVIRVCSDCNTTKTPLWRSGPCGPKSLCNACGIRQRKARRAMMASGASSITDGAKAAVLSDAGHPKVKKEKRADVDRSLPFKKRCKVVQDHTAAAAATTAAPPTDKAVVQATAEVVGASLSRDLVDNIGLISRSRPSPAPASAAAAATTTCSSFRPSPALPVQDEITDAAMLLMTLSCGLVRS